MNLYRDQPGLRNRRIGFGVVDGLDAVKPDLDAWALGADAVIIPLAQRLHGLFLGGGVGPSEDLVAATLIIQAAVVARAEVSLVAFHLIMIRDTGGTELHAPVHEALGTFELPL